MSSGEESSSGGGGLNRLGRGCSDNRGRRLSGGRDFRGGRGGHSGDRKGLDRNWCCRDRNRGGHCNGSSWGSLSRDAERCGNGDRSGNGEAVRSGNALPEFSASSGFVISRLVGLGFLTITELSIVFFIPTSSSFSLSDLFSPSLSSVPLPSLPSSASSTSSGSPGPSSSGGSGGSRGSRGSRGSTRLILFDHHRRRGGRRGHRHHRNDRDNRGNRDNRDHLGFRGFRLILDFRFALKSHPRFSFDLDLRLDLGSDLGPGLGERLDLTCGNDLRATSRNFDGPPDGNQEEKQRKTGLHYKFLRVLI